MLAVLRGFLYNRYVGLNKTEWRCPQMRKKSLLALLLVLVMILPGCALDVVNEGKDMARTVVEVNGEIVSKRVITSAINDLTSQYEENYNTYLMYYQYGLIDQMPSMPTAAQIQSSVIQSYVNSLVSQQKAVAGGFDQLTDEEKAQAEEAGAADYNTFLQSVISTYFADTTLEGDELTAEVEKFVADSGIVTADGRSTLADFVRSAELSQAVTKLQASITDAVTVSEEELQADFDAHVEADKASFTVSEETAAANQTALEEAQQALADAQAALKDAAEDADLTALQAAVDAAQAQVTSAESAIKAAIQTAVSSYESAKNRGDVYYNLPGYRKVQHILIPVETSEETTAAKAALTEAQSALTDARAALEGAAEDADTAALQAAVDAAQAQVDEIQAQADAAAAADKEAAQAKARDVYELAIAEGADFDALIREYNQDNSAEGTFYYVSAGSQASFVEGFITAAMSVENKGDVSEPVESELGWHIVKYVDDVTEGAVSLDEVREELSAHVLEEKQEETLEETLAQWIAEADVKTYPEKLN